MEQEIYFKIEFFLKK